MAVLKEAVGGQPVMRPKIGEANGYATPERHHTYPFQHLAMTACHVCSQQQQAEAMTSSRISTKEPVSLPLHINNTVLRHHRMLSCLPSCFASETCCHIVLIIAICVQESFTLGSPWSMVSAEIKETRYQAFLSLAYPNTFLVSLFQVAASLINRKQVFTVGPHTCLEG